MVLFYHNTGGNSLKFVGFGKKSEGYNMKSFLVRIYVVALMADNINGLLGLFMAFILYFLQKKQLASSFAEKITHSPCILADFRYNI